MKRAKIIAFANQKGGVGKTTSISAVASILHQKKKKVLTVSLDAQRNLDMVAGEGVAILRSNTTEHSILSVLDGRCTIHEAIVKTQIGDMLRATNQLYAWGGAQAITKEKFEELKDSPELLRNHLENHFSNEYSSNSVKMLTTHLEKVSDRYDYILIDTNPTLTLLTLNSLYAAQYVVIPSFSERSSGEAILELSETINAIKLYNPTVRIDIAGILMTKYDKRRKACVRHDKNFEKLAPRIGTIVFDTRIRSSAKASEYVEYGMDIVRYDPKGTTATDYKDFVKELIKRIKEIDGGYSHG